VAHYFDIYERYFSIFRGKKQIKMLEIGVASGGSQLLWHEYFGEGLELHGLDINTKCSDFHNPPLYHVHIGSQDDVELLRRIVERHGPFDIILDDGSHVSKHMIASFHALYASVRAGGVYIVEDTMTNYFSTDPHGPFAAEGRGKAGTFMELAKELVDDLNLHNSNMVGATGPSTEFTRTTTSVAFYDAMVVFEKGTHKRAMQVASGDVWIDHN